MASRSSHSRRGVGPAGKLCHATFSWRRLHLRSDLWSVKAGMFDRRSDSASWNQILLEWSIRASSFSPRPALIIHALVVIHELLPFDSTRLQRGHRFPLLRRIPGSIVGRGTPCCLVDRRPEQSSLATDDSGHSTSLGAQSFYRGIPFLTIAHMFLF